MDLESEPELASKLCLESHARLLARADRLGDAQLRQPSRLPGWSVAHVLTHLARNADAHARRVQGALDGVDVPKYANGQDQRRQEIEDGVQRSTETILDDLTTSILRLDALFISSSAAQWPNGDFLGGGHYGVAACPAHRLREVEMHHVDLGMGYEADQWPAPYVAWDLQILLSTVPERVGDLSQRQRLMAWLAGRGALDPAPALDPWG